MQPTSEHRIRVDVRDAGGRNRFANLIVRPREQERFRIPLARSNVLLVSGTMERGDGGVIHVITKHIEDLSPVFRGVVFRSRDFQ